MTGAVALHFLGPKMCPNLHTEKIVSPRIYFPLEQEGRYHVLTLKKHIVSIKKERNRVENSQVPTKTFLLQTYL